MNEESPVTTVSYPWVSHLQAMVWENGMTAVYIYVSVWCWTLAGVRNPWERPPWYSGRLFVYIPSARTLTRNRLHTDVSSHLPALTPGDSWWLLLTLGVTMWWSNTAWLTAPRCACIMPYLRYAPKCWALRELSVQRGSSAVVWALSFESCVWIILLHIAILYLRAI